MKRIFQIILLISLSNFLQNDILLANVEDTVVSDNTQYKSNDTIILFEENFNDGDFTNNPAWTSHVTQKCAPKPAKIFVEDGILRIYQKDARTCGTGASIYIKMNIPVTESTKIKFDVKPTFSSVDEGAGWKDREYPVSVRLQLYNKYNEYLTLWFAYNYRGGESYYFKDFIRVAFTECLQDVWIRNEVFSIRDYFANATTIIGISIEGRGWDYDGSIDNIVVFDQHETGKAFFEQKQMEKENISINKYHKHIDLCRENIRLYKKMGEAESLLVEYMEIGDDFSLIGQYDSAVINFEKALIISNEIDQENGKIKSLINLAKLYPINYEYKRALECLNNLLKIYNNNDNEIINTLNDISRIYKLSGNIQKAIDNYYITLELCKKSGNTEDLAKTYKYIADTYYNDSLFNKALEYYQKSYKLYEKLGDLNSAALSLFYISNIFYNLKNYGKAIVELNRLSAVIFRV